MAKGPSSYAAEAERLVERTTEKSGVPRQVEDHAVLARIATVLRSAQTPPHRYATSKAAA
jgi:hypothetical protein